MRESKRLLAGFGRLMLFEVAMLSIPRGGKSTLSPGPPRPKLAADGSPDSSLTELSEQLRLLGFRHFVRFSDATELHRILRALAVMLIVPVRAERDISQPATPKSWQPVNRYTPVRAKPLMTPDCKIANSARNKPLG